MAIPTYSRGDLKVEVTPICSWDIEKGHWKTVAPTIGGKVENKNYKKKLEL